MYFKALFYAFCHFFFVSSATKVEEIEKSVLDYTLQELGHLSHIDPDSECFHGIGKTIEICRQGVEELGSERRKTLALQLTLCEMRNLNLCPPSACSYLHDDDDCIHEIEKVPQYWTMFSGNYRDISKICFEWSLPYEKSQVLALYTNITEVVRKLYFGLDKSVDNQNQRSKDVEKKFEEVFELVQQLTNDFVFAHDTIFQQMGQSAEDVRHALETGLSMLNQFRYTTSADMAEMAQDLTVLGVQLKDISRVFSESTLREEMASLARDVSDKMKEVAVVVDTAVAHGKEQIQSLEAILDSHGQHGQKIVDVLKDSDNLAANIHHLLGNIETKVLSQRHSLAMDTEYIGRFLNELLFGLEASFSEAETRMDSYLAQVDGKVSQTLQKLDKMENSVDRLDKGIGRLFSFFTSAAGFAERMYHKAKNAKLTELLKNSCISIFAYLNKVHDLFSHGVQLVLASSMVVVYINASKKWLPGQAVKMKKPRRRRYWDPNGLVTFAMLVLTASIVLSVWMIYEIESSSFDISSSQRIAEFVEKSETIKK